MTYLFPTAPRRAVAAAVLLHVATSAHAQSAASSTVVITGNPLGRTEVAQPSDVLSGDRLVLRRAGTLGETLSGLPGVASTGFGPQSGRPVIRGLDGDRVRLLDNAGASVDASNLSFDHAVTLDPLVAERIEVLRGPAALLYGGNATGGVVNVIDNRIPRNAIDGLGGRAELRLGGAASEKAGAALLEGGRGGVSWHVDVADRRSEDLRVPRFTPPAEGEDGDDGEQPASTRRVRNSAGHSQSGAVGASWADADGFVGASVDGYRNDYGVTAEPDVTIRMKRDRVALAGERSGWPGPFSKLEFQASATDYQHQEVEGSGEIGTTFKSKGRDLRVQARHRPIGPVEGVIGVQAEQLDFSALGEEAFVPDTTTRSTALFALEELRAGPVTLTGGLRVERVRVRSAGDAPTADNAEEDAKFGEPAERRFTPRSMSVAAQWPLAGGWGLSATLGTTERAPAYYELYANGIHVATGAFERGDPGLGLERSRHIEFGTQWNGGPHSAKANLFLTRFSRYIGLNATGRDIATVDEESGEAGSVPEYAFAAIPATLKGLEVQGRSRLAERPWTIDLTAGLDLVRGEDRSTGEPLARLPPWRLQTGLEVSAGAWQAIASLRHSARQSRVPSTDVPTPSSTLLDLFATWRHRIGTAEALWYVKLENAFDELAYNASAIRTVRELSPQPGRALGGGVRLTF